MAQLGNTYNVDDLGEMQDFSALPEDTYPMVIVKSEMKPNKANTGSYLLLEMDVTSGQYQGRKLFERLNLINPNETAVRIAQQTLGSLCIACGVKGQIADSQQLHNVPFLADVKLEEGSEYQDPKTGEMKKGNPQNKIVKYHAWDNAGSAPVASAPAQNTSPQQEAAPPAAASAPEGQAVNVGGGNQPPWKQQG